ncbi:MAG: CotH kinase family protein [Candidatus Saccharibacteria bacterium]
MKKRALIYLLCNILFISYCIAQQPGDQLFDNSKIHEIKIVSLKEGLLDTLGSNYILSFGMNQMQTREIPYTAASIIVDGMALDSIGLRYKGFNSWWRSVKKPLKVDLNEYKSKQQYDGLKKFNLHNGSSDPSFIRENLSYKILRSMGIKAPRTAYAKVYLDTAYLGVYRLVEQIDNAFLDVNFGNHDGNLYKQHSIGASGFSLSWLGNSQQNYNKYISLENHQSVNDWSDFIHFLDVLNNTPDDQFKEAISKVLDVEEYLQVLAFDIAVNNLDFYGNSGRNYYLYNHNGVFHWLPWDYNLTWLDEGPSPDMVTDEAPVLIKRILQVPEFHSLFLQKYCMIQSLLSEASLSDLIIAENSQVSALMEKDPHQDYPYEAFLKNPDEAWNRIDGLKPYAEKRIAEISGVLDKNNITCTVSAQRPPSNSQQLKLYPVPACDWVTIGVPTQEELTVSIISNSGQVVKRATIHGNEKLNVSSLTPGSYIVKAQARGMLYSKLLLINH